MENSWTDRVTCESIPWTEGKKCVLHTITRRNDNWIGHISRRNCLLKHVIEGKIEGMVEVTDRRGRRRK
jgi:hypothetical protein